MDDDRVRRLLYLGFLDKGGYRARVRPWLLEATAKLIFLEKPRDNFFLLSLSYTYTTHKEQSSFIISWSNLGGHNTNLHCDSLSTIEATLWTRNQLTFCILTTVIVYYTDGRVTT